MKLLVSLVKQKRVLKYGISIMIHQILNEETLCLEENEDIVKLPSDVPIRMKKWDNMNPPSKNKVRRLAVAYIKKISCNYLGKDIR
jgi:hypothetical protein